VIRRSYQSLQAPVVDAERPKRSADVFAAVEQLIQERFQDLPDGCPHLRNAILYCRSRNLPVSRVRDVREQMMERS
jgi:hypothetical protein